MQLSIDHVSVERSQSKVCFCFFHSVICNFILIIYIYIYIYIYV